MNSEFQRIQTSANIFVTKIGNLLYCKQIKIVNLLTLNSFIILLFKISNNNYVDTIYYLSLYYFINDLIHLPNSTTCFQITCTISLKGLRPGETKKLSIKEILCV
jgi:hypothetical protein